MWYRITSPQKQGNIIVVDVLEGHGNSILRRTTIREEQIKPFINAIFKGD